MRTLCAGDVPIGARCSKTLYSLHLRRDNSIPTHLQLLRTARCLAWCKTRGLDVALLPRGVPISSQRWCGCACALLPTHGTTARGGELWLTPSRRRPSWPTTYMTRDGVMRALRTLRLAFTNARYHRRTDADRAGFASDRRVCCGSAPSRRGYRLRNHDARRTLRRR